ncbi:capsule assembly Wzi family protein [Rubrolithibacter danxiaensis]|uniref:capsule assembly Wzi family protein n=1 Tax=Rubrolithibacter danxiaensis TaxID=3390805 RepID=UPI003BF788CE
MRLLYFLIIISAFLSLLNPVNAQPLPAGMPVLEDVYRRAQLNGDIDSTLSFTIRPIFPVSSLKSNNTFDPDSTLQRERWIEFSGLLQSSKNTFRFQILPLIWQQEYNSSHPYGWNDGMMVPSKGYQTMISGGVFVKAGPLSIQLRPEFVYAQNLAFKGFSATGSYPYNTNIDLPERFGNKPYSEGSLGQSSIRLTFDPVSVGISNENLWWGPGLRNSLLMSNNAQGFKHFTLNTIRPVKTPLGFIEGQIVGGRLEGSGYTRKKEDWRYLSGFAFSYHPKWIPGLFLGLTRTFQMYHEDMDGRLDDYFPFFQPFEKVKTNEGEKIRDQLTSVFVRWLWQKAKAELYLEYGRNDHSYNLRDFTMTPEHSRAYIFGMRKLIPLNHKQEQILVALELTQLQQTINYIVRNAGAWYLHGQVLHGYTHKGEVLGAGIGPGSNLQSFEVSWVKNLKKIGLQFERYTHNNDYYNANYSGSALEGNWADFAISGKLEWNYRNLILNADLTYIKSLDYQWRVFRTNAFEESLNRNPSNLHALLGITYRF